MVDRAVSPVIGVVCLVAITVVLAAGVGAGTQLTNPPEPTTASFEVTIDDTGEVTVLHRGGDSIDPAALDVHVRIDGEPLDRQPPVPFFSADGFESGPTGPFNSARSEQWRAGETASFRIAGTNSPTIGAGDTVTVRISVDGHSVARLETTI